MRVVSPVIIKRAAYFILANLILILVMDLSFSDPESTSKQTSDSEIMKITETKAVDRIFIDLSYDTWHVTWIDLNDYLDMYDINPTQLMGHSLALNTGKFKISAIFYGTDINANLVDGFDQVEETISFAHERFEIDSLLLESNKVFHSKFRYGQFKGSAYWEYIEDPGTGAEGNETISFTSDTLIFDFSLGKQAEKFRLFRSPLFGLRYISYNLPLFIPTGNTMDDPLDPENQLIDIELVDTKVNHIFLVYDVLGGKYYEMLMDKELMRNTATKQKFFWNGNLVVYPIGIGKASNEIQGEVMTWSFINPLTLEFELGANYFVRFTKYAFLKTGIGVRWFQWGISIPYDYPDNKIYVAKEVYWGPFFYLTLRF